MGGVLDVGKYIHTYNQRMQLGAWAMSQNSLACTQNPLFVTSHGGLDMIFRDPTCPYAAVVVAVVVCVDVYY